MWGQSECVGWERGKRERLSGVRDSVGRERVHRVRVGLKECVGGESCGRGAREWGESECEEERQGLENEIRVNERVG